MWCLGLDMLVSKKNQVNNFMINIFGDQVGKVGVALSMSLLLEHVSNVQVFFFLFGV